MEEGASLRSERPASGTPERVAVHAGA
jgi:hypothetical protein